MKTLPNDGVSADIENLDSLNDEALARLAQNGSSDAEHTLVVRFMPLVRIKARPYFLIGADHSDLVQEGSIGLFSAIRDYDCEKHTSFRTYAEVCIGNNIIAAIKRATREKHFPLNSYISLDKPVFFDNPDDEARCLGDSILLAATIDPEELALDREAELHILHGLKAELTELELSVLRLYISGKSYAQIAESIGRSTKTVDNALTRIKKKVSKLIRANNPEQS